MDRDTDCDHEPNPNELCSHGCAADEACAKCSRAFGREQLLPRLTRVAPMFDGQPFNEEAELDVVYGMANDWRLVREWDACEDLIRRRWRKLRRRDAQPEARAA